MDYNKSYKEKNQYKKYFNIASKKNIIEDDLFDYNNLINLQNKIKELNNKIEFCKNCNKEFFDSIIIESINNIDKIIIQLNKNIIINGQFNRKTKLIEFEF